MSYELEVEAVTLTALAESIENSEHAPEEFAIAIHGVAHRLKEMANRVEGGEKYGI